MSLILMFIGCALVAGSSFIFGIIFLTMDDRDSVMLLVFSVAGVILGLVLVGVAVK